MIMRKIVDILILNELMITIFLNSHLNYVEKRQLRF